MGYLRMKDCKDQIQKEKVNSTSKIRFLCFIGAVILLLSGCSVYMRLTPDRTYSAEERRMLAERPKLTKKSVMRGKYQKKYETYLSEQFPGRTYLAELRTRLSRLLGERDANGVYFGKDDYLLEQYRMQDFDWKRVRKNVKQTAAFLKEYPHAKVMFVPVKSSVLEAKLPMFAQTKGEERFFELTAKYVPQKQQIAVTDVLKAHDLEYIYYRTDHHWTTLGAYYAYETWARSMGFSPVPQEQFTVTSVSTTFLGTTYAKVRTGGRADTISLYEPLHGPAYELDYNMGEFQSDSFYDLSKLEGEDPYSVFFGGNQALVDIRAGIWEDNKTQADIRAGIQENDKTQADRDAGSQEEGRTLLVIKDSFGNCFAPFAANHYARTVVVDLRYVNIPVSKLMRVYPADDILILYNSAQFMDDKDISKLK